ncbi:MAG: ureidoglycolate lyase [Telmatospirillum sp.]|nr:ureidoglycolate lyase [Telmatospirillum sp.]
MTPTQTADIVDLVPQPIAASAFAPYGQLIAATQDGALFGPQDAQLVLSAGTPRFYIMALSRREPVIRGITCHVRVTQCLASVGGVPWYLLVAPPGDVPDPKRLAAFVTPGNVAVKLHVGTWHAGPYFAPATCDFFNLELSDTNETDHRTLPLDRAYRLVYPPATA